MGTDRDVHLAFINSHPFQFRVNGRGFTPEEIAFIQMYGHWLKALTTGQLAPLTKQQEQFVEEMNSRKTPKLGWVRLWKRYLRREIEEKDERGVLRAPAPRTEDDPFYSRAGVKEQRSRQFRTIAQEHRR